METHKFGSIYFDGKVHGPGSDFVQGATFMIGNTSQYNELGWIKAGDIFISSCTICPRITWADLNNMGFIIGRPVSIDGIPYLCRCLKVGLDIYHPKEWDKLLDEVGDMNGIWNCEGLWFWGQELHPENTDFAVCRGGEEPRGWNYAEIKHASSKIGFRPVLEKLPPMPALDESMIGAALKVYSNEGCFHVSLVDFNDYDITAKPIGEMDFEHSCVQKDGDEVIINRNDLIWGVCESV